MSTSSKPPTGRGKKVGAAVEAPVKKQHPPTDERGRRRNAAARARALAAKQSDATPVPELIDGPVAVREVEAPLRSPTPPKGIIGVIKQPYLLRLLVRREIAKMYSASILGLFWSYVQPAIRFSVYYLVFGVVLSAHKNVPNFAIHLFCGIVFTHFFAEVFGGGTRSIWANKQLVQKMAMPREIFPVSFVIVGFYHIFPQVLLLIVVCVLSGFSVDAAGVLALFLGLAIITVFAGACGMLFSAFNVYYRDFQNVVGTITQLMHFMVPMMYAYERIAPVADSHPVLYQLYMGNPVCNAVILVQRFFWAGVNNYDASHGGLPNGQNAVFPPDLLPARVHHPGACLVFLYLCQRVFSRLESKFPERI